MLLAVPALHPPYGQTGQQMFCPRIVAPNIRYAVIHASAVARGTPDRQSTVVPAGWTPQRGDWFHLHRRQYRTSNLPKPHGAALVVEFSRRPQSRPGLHARA